MTCICIEREGVPKKEVTKHGQRTGGGRDIHPCWGFVAANVIAWNGAKTLLGRWISFPRRLDYKSPYKNLRSNFTFGLVEGFKSWIGGMLGSGKNSLALEGMFFATVNFLSLFRSRKLHSAAGTRKGGVP